MTSVTNSVNRRLPIWLGPLPDAGDKLEKLKDNGNPPTEPSTLGDRGIVFFTRGRDQLGIGMLKTGASPEASAGGTHVPTAVVGTRGTTLIKMKLLLVHQNFPGQFRDLGPALCDRGHELKAIGSSQRPSDPRIEVLRYEHSHGERLGMHPQSLEVDEWIHRSEKVARLAMALKKNGWAPEVMLAHPGWGEALLRGRCSFHTTGDLA